MEDVGVDAVRNDLPIGVEVAIERDGRAVRHGDGRAQHVEALLEKAAAERVADRPIEVRMEGADDRAIRLFDREDREHWRERRMDVDDVVPAFAQDAAHVAAEMPTHA